MAEIKLKVYPSSSGFAEGRLVYTDYNSGCLRKIGFNALGVLEPFPESTAQVGADNEQNYEEKLKAEGTPYEREKTVTVDLGAGVHLSGRIDFITRDRLIELKSTRSPSKRTKLRAGTVTTENVAQIVAYMVATERDSAELIYTYIDEKKKTQEHFNFTVKIDSGGRIHINGELYRYDVYSYLAHRGHAVDLLSKLSNSVGSVIADTDRPAKFADKFGSPCNYCAFRSACGRLDKGGVTEVQDVVRLAKESLVLNPRSK